MLSGSCGFGWPVGPVGCGSSCGSEAANLGFGSRLCRRRLLGVVDRQWDQLLQFDKIEGADEEGQDNNNISTIYIYKMFLAKEKALYQTLNMMKWQA